MAKTIDTPVRRELRPEMMPNISAAGRKVLRDYTEAFEAYSWKGSRPPAEHEAITAQWRKARRAMISYLTRLEEDKVIKKMPKGAERRAVFAHA